MASTVAFLSVKSPKCYRINQSFLSSNSLLKLKKQTSLSTRQFKNVRATPLIFAAQSNFLKGTIFKFFSIETIMKNFDYMNCLFCFI